MSLVIDYGMSLCDALDKLYQEVETNPGFMEDGKEQFGTEKEVEAFKKGALKMLGSIIVFLKGDLERMIFEKMFGDTFGRDVGKEELN